MLFRSGKKIILMDDIGQVFACEHLLDRVMGNVRDFDYNLERLLSSDLAKRYRQDIVDKKCNCRWDCAMNNSSISDIKNYPDLILKAAQNTVKALIKKEN